MKAFSKTMSLLIGSTLALAACGPGHSQNNGANAVHVQANAAKMDGEQLALAGEQLMAPHSFMLADKVFDMALEKEPSNQRATFYKEFLRPLMVVKGGAARIRPLVAANSDASLYDKTVSKLPNSSAKSFLQDGPADIKTAFDAQTLLVAYTDAIFHLYDYLKKNQTMTMTLNMNPFVFKTAVEERRDESCTVVENSDQMVDVICDQSDILQTKLNVADMIALRQMVAGEALYFLMGTSYSVDGAEAIYKKTEHQQLTKQQIINVVQNTPAGKLRNDNKLSRLLDLGSDLDIAWKWAVQNQANLCPAQGRREFLFNRGICVKPTTSDKNKLIAAGERALQGATSIDLVTADGKTKTMVVNPFIVSTQPIQDLKSVLPASYDSCGNAQSLKDKTIGGIFPNGDADQFIKRGSCAQ